MKRIQYISATVRVAILLIIALTNTNVYGQLLINEVCPRNVDLLADENNKYNDWIEILNTSNDSIDLDGWYLSDDITYPEKWAFPSFLLPPDSHLVVIADKKDRGIVVDHWESAVLAENTWKYRLPNENPDSSWNTLDFDDSLWLEGPGGIGRGDGDDNTIIPDSVISIYMRRPFTVFDTSKISSVILHVDFDEAFVAFLNGVEIARAEIGWPGKYQDWDDWALGQHLAQMYQGLPPDEFKIDMVFFSSIVHEGENVLAIQVLNGWGNLGNMSIIPFLSFGINDTSHLYQEVPEWFDENPTYFHTNFALNKSGESLMLSNSGEIVDVFEYPYLQANNSYGYQTDGVGYPEYFEYPTPGFTNNFSPTCNGYAKQANLSPGAGFYPSGVQVSILNYEEGDSIRFTRTGAIPGDTSELYTGPFNVDTSTVVRARVFKSGLIPGKPTTNTYIIGYTSSLPVISIGMNPYDLWDWEEGIYVMGPNADPDPPFFGANFWMDWEKPVHVEYFDSLQNQGFEVDADILIHGGFSRENPQKSVRLIMDGTKYDDPWIDYQFFGTKDIQSFKRIVLRNSGQDYNITQFRDGFMHKLVQANTNMDIQDYKAAVVFLNGQYWGIQNIREKIDRYYTEGNFGVDGDSVEILRDNIKIVEGDYYHYLRMIDYVKHVPVVDSMAYDSISKFVDIENYSDYFISEIFFVNHDWPGHNTKYWRQANDTSRWRYILTDTDFGFGLYGGVYNNEIHRVLHGTIQWSDNHRILRRLVENEDYLRYFINRSADIFNTVLKQERILTVLDNFKENLYPEITAHTDKWGGSLATWESNVDEMFFFAENRHNYIYQHYIDEFDLEKTVEVDLDIDSISHGHIQINTIVADSLPWQGVYFDGNPIELTAIADSAFVFSHWASNPVISDLDTLNPHLVINVDTNSIFKAFFAPDTFQVLVDTPLVVFSEINYRSSDSLDASDWVEILNIDTISHNISGWVFKDSNDGHSFVITDSIVLDTNAYLIICRDTAKFSSIYPDSLNVTGPFEFGLAANGEEIRLFDTTGLLVSTVTYSNSSPWPTGVDGTGRTLELIDPYDDLNNPSNWFAGCFGGSPGGPFVPCDTVGITEIRSNIPHINLFPNPFVHETQMEFELREKGTLTLQVFDIYGNLTAQVIYPDAKAGKNILRFRNNKLNKGVYFYHLSGKRFNFEGKMIIK
ncbi:MAG: T9SS type A sorting domain-containing protein [Chlorobi bacterium]|nr:T9SS type A sorting domain-containing protein [Chlorobiota bacterium]